MQCKLVMWCCFTFTYQSLNFLPTFSCWFVFLRKFISSRCFFSSSILCSWARFSTCSHRAFCSLTCLSSSAFSAVRSFICNSRLILRTFTATIGNSFALKPLLQLYNDSRVSGTISKSVTLILCTELCESVLWPVVPCQLFPSPNPKPFAFQTLRCSRTASDRLRSSFESRHERAAAAVPFQHSLSSPDELVRLQILWAFC